MTTQRCDECGIHLIIGITGELTESGAGDPDVLCLNCGCLNVAKDSLEYADFDETDEHDEFPDCDDDGDEGFWFAAAQGYL